jgi:ABC-type branched-subunit amino acid transport system ATPase component
MAKPKLLILDEPTLGIMPKLEILLWGHSGIKKQGLTILLLEQKYKKKFRVS